MGNHLIPPQLPGECPLPGFGVVSVELLLEEGWFTAAPFPDPTLKVVQSLL